MLSHHQISCIILGVARGGGFLEINDAGDVNCRESECDGREDECFLD